MEKRSILFAYPAMMIGGSTTSLLSILSNFDYEKYDVDLLLNSHTGALLGQIPERVTLLPAALKFTDRRREYFHRLISPRYMYHFTAAKRITRRDGNYMHGAQYLEWKDAEFFRRIEKEYDVAVAFLEGDRCKFVARHVKAGRKVAWIHVNYADAGFDPKYDRDTMCAFDRIVLVSNDCKTAFDNAFPELSDRTVVIENILSSEVIRGRAREPVDFTVPSVPLNLVTTCRINFRSKGLDRAARVIGKLKREGLADGLHWTVIGDGENRPDLERIIAEEGIGDLVTLLGAKTNPYPYMKDMDVFFLPSRFEGKPMAVTEALMLGLPVLATEYSSAREQIRQGIDGFIVPNSEDGIYTGLRDLLADPTGVRKMKYGIVMTDYGNADEFLKVMKTVVGPDGFNQNDRNEKGVCK